LFAATRAAAWERDRAHRPGDERQFEAVEVCLDVDELAAIGLGEPGLPCEIGGEDIDRPEAGVVGRLVVALPAPSIVKNG
jgi:hypothetical protein